MLGTELLHFDRHLGTTLSLGLLLQLHLGTEHFYLGRHLGRLVFALTFLSRFLLCRVGTSLPPLGMLLDKLSGEIGGFGTS